MNYYKESWGEPKIQNMTADLAEGNTYSLEFTNSTYGTSGPNFPHIKYKTTNYKLLGDHGGEQTCFDCIDFNKSASEIADELGLYLPKESSKLTISGKPAFSSKYEEGMGDGDTISVLDYYIPNAYNNHHLKISIGRKYAEELNEFIKTINLK